VHLFSWIHLIGSVESVPFERAWHALEKGTLHILCRAVQTLASLANVIEDPRTATRYRQL
jgi:hypothetical protein